MDRHIIGESLPSAVVRESDLPRVSSVAGRADERMKTEGEFFPPSLSVSIRKAPERDRLPRADSESTKMFACMITAATNRDGDAGGGGGDLT